MRSHYYGAKNTQELKVTKGKTFTFISVLLIYLPQIQLSDSSLARYVMHLAKYTSPFCLCNLKLNVICSMQYMLFTIPVYCLRVGASLRSQCLVIAFLLATMRIWSKHYFLISSSVSMFPENNKRKQLKIKSLYALGRGKHQTVQKGCRITNTIVN